MEVSPVRAARVVAFLEKRPDLCLRLTELLCARLPKSEQRMLDIVSFELSLRLAKMLLGRAGTPGRAGTKPKLSLSQTELAGMINATPRRSTDACAIGNARESWMFPSVGSRCCA